MSDGAGYWSRLRLRRVSRRRSLALGASVGVAGFAFAACRGNDDPAAGPREGGVLRTGTTSPFSGLDPQTEAGTGLAIVARLYGYLLHVDPRDETIIYDHAESVEQPDPQTYLFTLRKGVRFHDTEPVNGRELRARDIVASIQRFQKNALAPTRTFHTEILDTVEAIEDRLLRVTVKRPYRYALSHLGDISAGAILPEEFVSSGTSLYTQAAGTGPFELSSTEPERRVTLARFDSYYRSPVPYLDAMEWQIQADNTAKLAAMRDHQVDVITAGARAELEALSTENEDIELTQEISLASTAIGFRVDAPPFNDQRVREAIDLALDRAALIDTVAAGEAHTVGPVNPVLMNGTWSLSEDEVATAAGAMLPTEERRVRARELLTAAGAIGATIELQVADTPQLVFLAESMSVLLAGVGLPVTLNRLDVLTWFNNFRSGRFQATVISNLPYESADIPLRFFHSRGPDGTNSPFAYAEADLDTLIERSWAEHDATIASQTALEIQRHAIASRPMIHLFTANAWSAAWTQVQNRRPGLPGSLAHYNFEQWLDV